MVRWVGFGWKSHFIYIRVYSSICKSANINMFLRRDVNTTAFCDWKTAK